LDFDEEADRRRGEREATTLKSLVPLVCVVRPCCGGGLDELPGGDRAVAAIR